MCNVHIYITYITYVTYMNMCIYVYVIYIAYIYRQSIHFHWNYLLGPKLHEQIKHYVIYAFVMTREEKISQKKIQIKIIHMQLDREWMKNFYFVN